MLNLPIAATASPVAPAAPSAAAPTPAVAHAGPGAFARELDRAAQQAPAAKPAAAADDGSNDDGAAPTAPTNGRDVRKPRSSDAERGSKTERNGARRSGDKTGSDGTTGAEAAQATPAAAKDNDANPDVSALLAHLMHHPTTPAAAATAASGEGRAAHEAATGVAQAEARLPAAAAAEQRLPAAAEAAANAPAFVLPQAAPAAAAAEPAAASAPAAYAAQIQAPVGSPEFAPDLSAQVSVMVRDGLQEAKLQLNPAEMGPITVQIQVDGSTAQVTMTAEQAPTRDALEQAMPTLAGALREEGLTLTGGGVFEQPQQPRDDAPGTGPGRHGNRSGHGADAGDDGAAAPARRVAVPRGAVDVYA